MSKEITYENIGLLQDSFERILESTIGLGPSQETAALVTEKIDTLFKEYGLEDIQFKIKPDGRKMTIVWMRPIDQLCVRALLPNY
jgi:hypothetical protein